MFLRRRFFFFFQLPRPTPLSYPSKCYSPAIFPLPALARKESALHSPFNCTSFPIIISLNLHNVIILSSICLSPKSSFLGAEPIMARSRRSFDSSELDSKAEILEFIPEVILSTQNLLFFFWYDFPYQLFERLRALRERVVICLSCCLRF